MTINPDPSNIAVSPLSGTDSTGPEIALQLNVAGEPAVVIVACQSPGVSSKPLPLRVPMPESRRAFAEEWAVSTVREVSINEKPPTVQSASLGRSTGLIFNGEYILTEVPSKIFSKDPQPSPSTVVAPKVICDACVRFELSGVAAPVNAIPPSISDASTLLSNELRASTPQARRFKLLVGRFIFSFRLLLRRCVAPHRRDSIADAKRLTGLRKTHKTLVISSLRAEALYIFQATS